MPQGRRALLARLHEAEPRLAFGSESSFGSPGSGGALGFADPDAEIGYGYVNSQMGTRLTGDPRDVALRTALYESIGREEYHGSETLERAPHLTV